LWASVVTGESGFLRAEDDRTLLIEAPPSKGDPLLETSRRVLMSAFSSSSWRLAVE
jgi:hypothetical protein